jgi:hypothetical protein
MAAELPIACSLDATAFAARQAEIEGLGATALGEVHLRGAHAELRFRDGVRPAVERFIEAETSCCPFFAMRLDDAADGVVLTIDVPPGAESILAELVDAFASRRST